MIRRQCFELDFEPKYTFFFAALNTHGPVLAVKRAHRYAVEAQHRSGARFIREHDVMRRARKRRLERNERLRSPSLG